MPPRSRTPKPPAPPSLPAALTAAIAGEDELEDEASLWQKEFTDIDLSGRTARLVEVEQSRLHGVNLTHTQLTKATFVDCVIDSADLANLHATSSSMRRVAVNVTRMTGTQWIDSELRDVTFTECRLDLSAFRFSRFTDVVFDRCNLTGADFTNADLRGARFVDCDLTGAQLAHANMAGAMLRRCVLTDIGSVTSLRGAVLESQDVIALAYVLADAMGIVLAAEADSQR